MSEITHLLVDRVTVNRLAEANQGNGRWSKDYVELATDVPFRISPASAREVRDGAQIRAYVTHVGYCEDGVDLQKDDIVTVTKRSGVPVADDAVPGYRVTGRVPPSLPKHLKVQLEQIQRAVVS